MLNINNYLKENQGEVVNAVGMAVAIPVAVTNLLEHIPNSKLASQIDLFKASKAYRSLGVCGMMVAAYHSAKSLDHLYSCWEQNIENKQLATDLLTVGSSAFTAINIALPVFFPEARIFQPSLRLAAFVVFDLGGLAAASYEGASSSDLLVNALLTAVFNCGKSDVAELKAGVKQAASFSSSLVHARHRAFDATEALDAEHSYLQEPQGWTISRSKDKNRAPTGIFGEQASAAERGFFGISLGGHIHRKGTPLIPSADDIRLVAGESAMRRTDVSFETGGWLPDGQRYVVTVSSKYDHKSGVSLSIEDPDNKLWKYFACELQEIHQQLGEIQNQTNDALVRNDEAKLAALSDREAAADRIETQLPAINRDNDIKQFFAAFLKLIHLMEKLPSAVESDPFTMHPIEGELAHGFAQDLLAIVGKLGQGIEIAKPKGSKRYSFATTICQCLNERNLDRLSGVLLDLIICYPDHFPPAIDSFYSNIPNNTEVLGPHNIEMDWDNSLLFLRSLKAKGHTYVAMFQGCVFAAGEVVLPIRAAARQALGNLFRGAETLDFLSIIKIDEVIDQIISKQSELDVVLKACEDNPPYSFAKLANGPSNIRGSFIGQIIRRELIVLSGCPIDPQSDALQKAKVSFKTWVDGSFAQRWNASKGAGTAEGFVMGELFYQEETVVDMPNGSITLDAKTKISPFGLWAVNYLIQTRGATIFNLMLNQVVRTSLSRGIERYQNYLASTQMSNNT